MVVQQLMALGAAMCTTPVMITMACILFLASIGKSLGVRRAYTKVLLKIFEVSNAFYDSVKFTHTWRLQANRSGPFTCGGGILFPLRAGGTWHIDEGVNEKVRIFREALEIERE